MSRVVDGASDTISPGAYPGTPQEEPVQRSLFGEILDWMLVPLLLLWPVSIAITYLIAKSLANQPFDRALDDRVTVLAQQVKEVDGRIAPLSGSARDFLRADDVDNVYYQITAPNGEVIDGERDMPAPAEEDRPQPWAVQMRYDFMRNAEVRIAYTYVNLHPGRPGVVAPPPRLVLVQVGETLDKRLQLANQIIKGVILPEFIILPVALALIWFALSRGLSPLAELQRHIRARRSDDLSPIAAHQVPEEIAPLVSSLNDLLGRLSQSIQLQKRFIADAAHQMKTPLAGMRMQSELALRQTSQEEIHRSLLQLSQSSEAATRLVNQLLALARAENQDPHGPAFVDVELAALARDVMHDWFGLSQTRNIDLGFEPPAYPVTVAGDPTMLRELLKNLLDNALHYTPAGGTVTVRVRADAARRLALLEVEDTGPGIAPTERSHVFERFYRILGNQQNGSGLGLAIVREIAQQHGATVDLYNNRHCRDAKYPGSLFRVALPMSTAVASASPTSRSEDG